MCNQEGSFVCIQDMRKMKGLNHNGKVLMVASVTSMIDFFNIPNIQLLMKMGYEVHVAANFEYDNTSSKERVEEFKKKLKEMNISYFHVDFSRNIKKIGMNIKAYKQLVDLLLKNKYELIHCHSPIGGVCGRLAAYKTKVKVIYTAHGFHFFDGAPIINWLLYYPIERWLAKYTDVLITINKEDYVRAQKFKAGRVVYIPGVGIDIEKFAKVVVDKANKLRELGLPERAFVILSVGELNKNKNHETIIKAISQLNNSNIYYVICGRGDRRSHLQQLSENLNISERVKLLGYRSDIAEIYRVADVYVFPSYREGLSMALMEAMTIGLPVVCSKIRGNIDLIEEEKGGYLLSCNDINGFANRILRLYENSELRSGMAKKNYENIKSFDIKNINNYMKTIYEMILYRFGV